MGGKPDPFDFWYAVNNTEVMVRPRQHLETFGATTINYHLVCEMMDNPGQVRVREGNIHAYRPAILTPQHLAENILEGFEEAQAGAYMDWLKDHEKELLIIQYGFKVKKETVNDHLVTDALPAVLERVRQELNAKDNPMDALLVGVDEPWEVCLLKLLVDMVQQAAPVHYRELRQDPAGARHEIEAAFRAASRDAALIPLLAKTLQRHNLFKDYEDRFFALVRSR